VGLRARGARAAAAHFARLDLLLLSEAGAASPGPVWGPGVVMDHWKSSAMAQKRWGWRTWGVAVSDCEIGFLIGLHL